MAPGPAMSGMASGKTARVGTGAVVGAAARRSCRRSKIISKAMVEEEQAAGDAEGVDRDAQEVEQPCRRARRSQDAERRERAADRDLGALRRSCRP